MLGLLCQQREVVMGRTETGHWWVGHLDRLDVPDVAGGIKVRSGADPLIHQQLHAGAPT